MSVELSNKRFNTEYKCDYFVFKKTIPPPIKTSHIIVRKMNIKNDSLCLTLSYVVGQNVVVFFVVFLVL